MKNIQRRRNKTFTSNVTHHTVEQFEDYEVLLSKMATIDKMASDGTYETISKKES